MTTPPPSLPTIFTPPPSCFHTILHTADAYFVLGEQSAYPSCLPSASGTSTQDYFLGSQCPYQWTPACSSTTTILLSSNPVPIPQIIVTCCPPGNYLCQTEQDLATRMGFYWLTQYGCISSWGRELQTPILVVPPTGTRYMYTFNIKETDAVNAPSVQLRYVDERATASLPTTLGSRRSTRTASETGVGKASETSAPNTVNASSSSDIMASWKIGVGVGIGGSLLVLLGLGFWVMRRGRARSISTTPTATRETGNLHGAVIGVPELGSSFKAKGEGVQVDIKSITALPSSMGNEPLEGAQELPASVSHPAVVELEGLSARGAVELQGTGRAVQY